MSSPREAHGGKEDQPGRAAIGLVTDLLGQGEAVAVRQLQVENDGIEGRAPAEKVERVRAVGDASRRSCPIA